MQIRNIILTIIILTCKLLCSQNIEEYRTLDQNLYGIWEVQLNSTEYMRISIDSLKIGYGPGSFMKFTKDASGDIDQIIYDSSEYSIPKGKLSPAIVIGWSDLTVTRGQGRTSYGSFVDYGVSRGDPYDRKKWDQRDVELRLYRDCSTCNLKMHFKITSKKSFASKPETLVPLEITLDKI